MDGPSADPAHMLAELVAQAPEERGPYLQAAGEPRQVLRGLIEQAERQVIDDPRTALDTASILVEAAEELADPGGQSRARRVRAQALAYANRFDDALDELTRSAELADDAGDTEAAARARLSMVHALARLGRLDDAIAAGESALRGFRDLDDPLWAAKAEANLGGTRRMTGDAAGALAHFDRARPVLAAEPTGLAQVDSNRAEALLELNRFAEAEAAFRSALQCFEQVGAAQAAAIVEGNIADLLSRQGRLEPALLHFERARRHFEAGSAAGDLARIEAEQAEAFVGAGLHEQAATGYAAAVPKLDESGLALEAVRGRTGLARVLMILGRFDEADRIVTEADGQLDELQSTAWLARVRLLQGQLAMARRQWSAARRALNAALQNLHDRPAEAAVARGQLAALALAQGDHDAAESLIDDALDAVSAFNLAPLRADLLHTRARLRGAQGRLGERVADLRSSVAEVERVRGTLQADRLRAAFTETKTTVYEDLVEAVLDADEPDCGAEAFATVERAKSRALLDLVAGVVPSAAVPLDGGADASASLLAEAARLHGDLNALYSRLPESGPASAISRWRRQVEACEQALQGVESRVASARSAGGLFAAPIDLEGAQRLLDSGTALLEYFIAQDEVMAFVVRKSSVRVFRRLTTREQLAEHVELARFQIERPLGYTDTGAASGARLVDDARRELADLYDVLIAPLGDALGGVERLIVVPHGSLHAVPFAALYDGRSYLGERFEISHAPSASVLANLPARTTEGPGQDALVLGVPDPGAPRIRQEIEAVARLLPGGRVHLGPDATCRCLREGAGDAGVIHLACHGIYLRDNPLASGLKLADGWMTVRGLLDLGLPGSLVVLSGCETGQATVRGGDELLGLVQGFLAGGASALLMTLWALHDESAEILVASVYEFWQNSGGGKKRSVAAALQAAQRRVRKVHPHPAFWAPFVLVGRP